MSRLDPIETTERIRDNYVRYLSTTFPIIDADLQSEFKRQLEQEQRLLRGPILEATPPFQTGSSISDLVESGDLSQEFSSLCGDEFPFERPLYNHQESAIRKLVLDRRNVVIASGTGSGKTEAFLVPIFNHLLSELESGGLSPGVRALLLYPMNALANDQMKRLRRILSDFPHLTFGRYTGETKETAKVARDQFERNYPDEPFIKNELHSREEMRDSPPHILLTNYAMLEYLLLRPKDHEFFDGEKAGHWRFIVIDEAHTYDGAKGMEMAMLIRRLKDRVVGSEAGRIQCVATSATLGKGQENIPRIAAFASSLFSERFEWSDNAPRMQDVVVASRIPSQELGPVWDRPNHLLYGSLSEAIASGEKSVKRLFDIAGDHGVPIDSSVKPISVDADDLSEESVQRFLYDILVGDPNLRRLRQLLEKGPMFLSDIASEVFSGLSEDDSLKAVRALVDLAVQAKSQKQNSPLLPARYHVFVRALEGAYLQMYPSRKLYLDRREMVRVGEERFPVFELGSCRRCARLYLVGKIVNGKLKQVPETLQIDQEELEFYLLIGEQDGISLDEDQEVLVGSEDIEPIGEYYQLCTRCAAIDEEGALELLCSCGSPKQRLRRVSSDENRVRHCLACGSRTTTGNLVRRFVTGQDAPVTVLATALYQEIPPHGHVNSRRVEESLSEEWESVGSSKDSEVFQQTGRQLLMFSDSRQDAAFFACYMEQTYHRILQRRLIIKTLDRYRNEVVRNKWRINDLIEPLRREAEMIGVFPRGHSLQQQKSEAWKWVLRELLTFERRYSLEGLGLLGFKVVQPEGWNVSDNHPLGRDPWGLSVDEIGKLYEILLDSFRIGGAVSFPDPISPRDEAFMPRNFEYYFREREAAPRRHIFAWTGSRRGRPNRRLDFLLKLSKQCASDLSEENCRGMLSDIWRRGFRPGEQSSLWNYHFQRDSLAGEGSVYRLRYEFWQLKPTSIDPSLKWYRCDNCMNLYSQNVRDICPTYQCNGRLSSCDPKDVFKGNHYRELYVGLKPLKMVSREHTAQLTSEAAAELQDQFMRGEVNVLSCSTTFELGVDVGELESVVMRNVPPTPANYVQRAGRAGRRMDRAAFCLTFCQRRSHDLTHFTDPGRMVSGEIRSPGFELRNTKIVRRHLHAVALAAFWRQFDTYFGKARFSFSLQVNPRVRHSVSSCSQDQNH